MKTPTLLVALALAVAFVLATPPEANAQTTRITLRVPVDLTELHPDVALARVQCRMARREADLDAHMTSVLFNGPGQAVDADGSARFVEELETAVNPALAAQLQFYKCHVRLRPKSGSDRRATPRSEHTNPGQHPAGLPFHVVQDGGRVEMTGKLGLPVSTSPTSGGVEQRRR